MRFSRFRRLCVWACAPFVCIAADHVALKNGDRVTGTVVRKDDKSLVFKSDAFGDITIPWDKVASLTTEKPVYVVLPGNETVLGTVETNGDQAVVATESDRRDWPVTDLVAIRNTDEQASYERLIDPAWTRLWTGNATLGWAGTRGNARALTLTAGLNAARVTTTDKTEARLSAIRATALVDGVSDLTAQAVRGGWAYTRIIASRLTWNGFNDYEYDQFQNLDLRFVAGGGLGFIVWKVERSRLDLLGGGAYNREAFSESSTQGAFARHAAEAYFGDEFTFKVSQVTSLYQNGRFFSTLNRAGEYRVNGDMGASTRLTKWLSWNIAISNRYLSNPVPGRKKNDFMYTTGIGVNFSR